MIDDEIKQKGICMNIWSGDEIKLKSSSFLKKNSYFKSLNYIDKRIYLKGFMGFLKVC